MTEATINASSERHCLEMRGNSTLLLTDPQAVWIVERGSVAVFRARIQGQHAIGQRRYLFTCCKGEVLLGGHHGAADELTGFLVVGLEDSVLSRGSIEDLCDARRAASNGDGSRLDQWIEKLTQVIVADTEVVYSEKADQAKHIRLGKGQMFKPPGQGTAWLRIEQGRVRLLGYDELELSSQHEIFPLGTSAWITAEEPTQINIISDELFDDPSALVSSLVRFHGQCFYCLKQIDGRERQRNAQRLEERQRLQQVAMGEALGELSSVLNRQGAALKKDTDLLTALASLGDRLGIAFQPPARSENMRRVKDPLDAIARASRVRSRRVQLRGQWWTSDCGHLLGYRGDENHPVALLRSPSGKYEIFDPRSGEHLHVNERTSAELLSDAVMFYRPFPADVKSFVDLAHFAIAPFRTEMAFILLLSLAGTLLGMLIPQATRLLIDQAIPDADLGLLVQLALALFAVACGQAGFLFAQGISTLRMRTGSTIHLQSGTWDRLLRLPASFFRRFASGDLLNRSMMVTEVSQEVSATAMRSLVTGFMSLLNVGLLFHYSPQLAWIGLLLALVSSGVTATLAIAIRKNALVLEMLRGRLFGFVVQLISGIAKLRVVGAEHRAFSEWTRQYGRQLKLTNRIQMLQDMGILFNFMVPTISSILLFYFAARSLLGGGAGVGLLTMGTFLAFYSAFGTFVASTSSVSNTIVDIMDSLAKGRLIRPIFDEPPEVDSAKVDPGRLSGNLSVQSVVFRYREDGPLILNDFSLQANAGEFVALVGPSGCGKSTTFRLLLGFETPEAGTITYDHQDLSGLDVSAVRRQIGVVLQSGRINAGSLFDSIATGNLVTLDEAWEAARDAGLADDIEAMPMGMHTVISEGATNLSGGQRQRLLIARALVANPRILLFDEATSALDNRTQAIVSQSINRRRVTRIAIAHRLSTVQHADRIYVIDHGRVVQSGTFEELASQPGLFKRMIERQLT